MHTTSPYAPNMLNIAPTFATCYHTKLKKIKSVLGAPNPYVFGPPGSASGSVSHKYGSGSGTSRLRNVPSPSKKSKKKLDFCCFVTSFSPFLSLKNDVNVPLFRIRIRIHMFLGFPDKHPDPLVKGTDPRIQLRTEMERIPNTGLNYRARSNLVKKAPNLH
jgi:hypothetical protein